MTDQNQKILLGISSCLLGEQVRFDGGHKNNAYINQTLGEYFRFKPFCPEVAIGLGIPREPIKLVKQSDTIQAIGVKNATLNVSQQLIECANEQCHWQDDIFGYIFKKDSPSCGMERVKVYTPNANRPPERNGTGLYAAQVMRNFPHLPIEEEGRLGDPNLRENFISHVFIYWRWKSQLISGLSLAMLTDFHAQHKLTFMSHDQDTTRGLGRLLSQNDEMALPELAEAYLTRMTKLLRIVPSRKNHVNVLQHIQGYLKKQLDRDDKAELKEVIEQYRLGALPLIVPITLLRHHFRKHPSDYILRSAYMTPHPKALMLLNHL
ncbi:MAG: DUF523 and DUF1722 domain-containing protein [Gammaproteobacteria bacterium]|nr:DUF523 and DUF1722 domain-containing protein [Gammaproteobacteria bacterium]